MCSIVSTREAYRKAEFVHRFLPSKETRRGLAGTNTANAGPDFSAYWCGGVKPARAQPMWFLVGTPLSPPSDNSGFSERELLVVDSKANFEIALSLQSRDPNLPTAEAVGEVERSTESLAESLRIAGYSIAYVRVEREAAFPALVDAILVKFVLGAAGGIGAAAGKGIADVVQQWLRSRWRDLHVQQSKSEKQQ